MPTLAVVGVQWGDEGKGKVTDYLAAQADFVVRYQGGANAGHTVVHRGEQFQLHLVPSGILYPGTICLIGNGVVIDPEQLIHELEDLEHRKIDTRSLFISDRAHVIMPYHKEQDRLEEERRGAGRIGTTGRGIGPCYADKVARYGIRMVDLLDRQSLEMVLQRVLPFKNALLQSVFHHPGFDPEQLVEQYLRYGEQLRERIVDTVTLVNEAAENGKRVLFEGAQGTLLDIDYGTYPFVTSSSPTAGGVSTGTGLGPTRLQRVVGVSKAYATRVGEGPFPSEEKGTAAEQWLRERGHEYGTTTGRPRRCGWFDAVVARYAVRVNGVTGLAITKLDVLDGLEKVKVCVGYRYQGQVRRSFPTDLRLLAECEPVWQEFPGWEATRTATRYDELPSQAQQYLKAIAELAGAPVALVSVGNEREATIVVEPDLLF